MNKCRNRKVKTSDGIVHDSIKELRRWKELQLLERAGLIKGLKRQVKFVLIPAQREQGTIGKRGGIKQGKLIERELSYIADFVYTENGKMVVEDAKGYKGGTVYALFVIKRKLMLYVHNIKVREI
jgi:predicted glycosyltransferase